MNLEKVHGRKPGTKTHMDLYFPHLAAEITTQAKGCFCVSFPVLHFWGGGREASHSFPTVERMSFWGTWQGILGCLGHKEAVVSQIFFQRPELQVNLVFLVNEEDPLLMPRSDGL